VTAAPGLLLAPVASGARDVLYSTATRRVRDTQTRRQVKALLDSMPDEEISYWQSKCASLVGVRALRVLAGRPWRKKSDTAQSRLQAAWDKSSDLMDAVIEFRPFKGWYAAPMEGRWFNDDGEFLGDNWKEATEQITWLAKGLAS
jgi:hypothetical protein